MKNQPMTCRACFTAAASLLLANAALAATQTYTVDQAQSQLNITGGNLSVSIFSFPVLATAPGSLTAPLAGFVDADLIEGPVTTIQILGTTRIDAVDHDAYLPGVLATPTVPAPGSFAVRFNTVPFTAMNVMAVTRGMTLTTEDEARVVTAGQFDADGEILSIVNGLADINMDPFEGDLSTIPPTKNLTFDSATLTQADGVETLTIPIAFVVDLSTDIALMHLDFAGTVVATRTLAPACPGDVAGNDSTVNVDDLNAILSVFNTSVGAGSPLDLANDDGFVDVDDLNVVLSNWGATCP